MENIRLEKIKSDLKNTPKCYHRQQIIKEVVEKYASNLKQLDAVPDKYFDDYSFIEEVLRLSLKKQKNKLITTIMERKKIKVKLETHAYAPELNKIYAGGEVFKTPQKNNIPAALNLLTVQELEKIIKAHR